MNSNKHNYLFSFYSFIIFFAIVNLVLEIIQKSLVKKTFDQ